MRVLAPAIWDCHWEIDVKRAPSTLQALGFSEIEALVYCYLLTNSPATGYRVSRGIGKPVANTYKAIADLKDRGVLGVSNDDKTIARPISPEELLGRLDGEFQGHRTRAAAELAKLSREPDDEHVYRLSTTEEVLSRARAMMDGAQKIVLIDAFPGFWDALRSSAAQAQTRGVTVLAKLYAPEDPAGMRVFRSSRCCKTSDHVARSATQSGCRCTGARACARFQRPNTDSSGNLEQQRFHFMHAIQSPLVRVCCYSLFRARGIGGCTKRSPGEVCVGNREAARH